jgi:hypothetical protein
VQVVLVQWETTAPQNVLSSPEQLHGQRVGGRDERALAVHCPVVLVLIGPVEARRPYQPLVWDGLVGESARRLDQGMVGNADLTVVPASKGAD